MQLFGQHRHIFESPKLHETKNPGNAWSECAAKAEISSAYLLSARLYWNASKTQSRIFDARFAAPNESSRRDISRAKRQEKQQERKLQSRCWEENFDAIL
jgi:hypothetical protein